MARTKSVLVFFCLFVFQIAHCDVHYDFMHREDTCINLCERIPLSTLISTTEPIENEKLEKSKSFCQRGCRFFNLIHLNREVKNLDFNDTRDSCDSSCREAYSKSQERSPCFVGCKYMAKQEIVRLLSLLSVALYMDEALDPSVLVMSLDMPDTDIMSDPGLKKELLPGWWTLNGFKLPQTFFQSVPKESMVLDYNSPSDYSGEIDQAVAASGSDFLQCASRHTGIPRWLLGLFMAVGATCVVWLCLCAKSSETAEDGNALNYKANLGNQIILLYPDEFCDKTPPGYSQFVDIDDEKNNVKV